MNDVIAAIIRNRPVDSAWTQEHLAGAAQVSARTVQRAEEGRGVSAETLSATAWALDVPIEDPRHEPTRALADLLGVPRDKLTPELIVSNVDEAKAKYATRPLAGVESSADLRPVLDADAFFFDCSPLADEVQDVAAELKQRIVDLLDIRGYLSRSRSEKISRPSSRLWSNSGRCSAVSRWASTTTPSA